MKECDCAVMRGWTYGHFLKSHSHQDKRELTTAGSGASGNGKPSPIHHTGDMTHSERFLWRLRQQYVGRDINPVQSPHAALRR